MVCKIGDRNINQGVAHENVSRTSLVTTYGHGKQL